MKEFDGWRWSPKKHRIAYRRKVTGLFNLIAARNIHNGDFIYGFYDFKNSFVIIDMFEKLLRNYPDKHLYIILDNWSGHRSNAVRAFVDMCGRITLIYLPFNASWLNEIERDFSIIDRCVLRNSNFQTPKEAMNGIIEFIKKEPLFNGRCS